VLGPNNPLSVLGRLFSFSPSTGLLCPFMRDFYGSITQDFLMPVLSLVQLLLAYVVVEIVARVRTGSAPDRTRWLGRPLQALLLGSYTPFANAALSILNCRQAANEFVVAAQPAYSCTSAIHYPYLIVSWLIVALYVLGLPVAIGIALFRLRTQLGRPWCQRTLGYVYTCYREPCFFWEVVLLLRRAVVTLLVLVPDISTQLYALTAACFAFTALQAMVQPHGRSIENVVETIALGLLTFIAMGAASMFSEEHAVPLQAISAAAVVLGIVLIVLSALWSERESLLRLYRAGAAALRRGTDRSSPNETDQLKAVLLEPPHTA
jgi:hypothetical protein